MLMSAHYPLRGLDYPCLHIAIGRYEPILTLKLFTLTKAVCLPTSVVTRDNTSHLFYFSSRMENNRTGGSPGKTHCGSPRNRCRGNTARHGCSHPSRLSDSTVMRVRKRFLFIVIPSYPLARNPRAQFRRMYMKWERISHPCFPKMVRMRNTLATIQIYI